MNLQESDVQESDVQESDVQESEVLETDVPEIYNSPNWNRNFKMIVTIVILLLIVFAIWRFGALIRYLVVAGIISFLLNPLVDQIERYFNVKRVSATLVVYLTLLMALITGAVSLGITGANLFEQLRDFAPITVPTVADSVTEWFAEEHTFTLFSWSRTFGPIDQTQLNSWFGELIEILQSSVSTLIGRSSDLMQLLTLNLTKGVIATITILGASLLVFTMSIYITLDVPRMENLVGDMAQYSGYRRDMERLFRDIARIWKAYLRGQLILALVIFVVVWILLEILGVNNAFSLGVLSGALEFLPSLGPIIGTFAAILVAIFQDSNLWGLSGWQFGLLVAVAMFIVQQVENSILVPRIIGNSLDLHPLVTMIVVVMGAMVAGILGAILAAPVAATFLLISRYAWRKLFDQPPFPKEEVVDKSADSPNKVRQLITNVINRVRPSSAK